MLKTLPKREEKGGWQIGDIHPNFPLLYVDRLNADGSVGGWGTNGGYWSWKDLMNDPNVLYVRHCKTKRFLKRHPSYIDAADGISDTPARRAEDMGTRSLYFQGLLSS